MKVLLVDEEEEFGSTLVERLRLRGIDARYASTVDQGIAEIRSWDPGIVVVDLSPLDDSGMSMIRRLRADFPKIEIVAITALGKTMDVSESLRLGARSALMKPLQIDELLEVFAEVPNNL
jgi:DNA-binding response OmpR family regulator